MSARKYTQADLEAVSDHPDWTAEEVRSAVPFDQAFPEMAAKMRRRGPQRTATKVSTTIRLSSEVIEHFRASGKGWQSRIDDALRAWIADHAA